MSILAIIALIVLVYIVQVLSMLAYPYYKYRQNYKEKENRTIGGFIEFTSSTIGDGYLTIVFFPIIGIFIFIVTTILIVSIAILRLLYDRYIKYIKI